MIPGAVDVGGLLELVWVTPVAVLATTVSFAGCVVGATRSSDARREGRSTVAAGWMVLAVVAGLLVVAEVAAGLAVIVAG